MVSNTMGDPNHKYRPNAKHVSRACLECRSKHIKCTGEYPVCKRCEKGNKDCNYVKSNRGGARKKGVKKQRLMDELSSEEEIMNSGSDSIKITGENTTTNTSTTTEQNSNEIEDMVNLPCMTSQFDVKNMMKMPCFKSCLTDPNHSCLSRKGAKELEFKKKLNRPFNILDYDEKFDENKVFKIIDEYYENFHTAHPFLPAKEDFPAYLENLSFSYDLLSSMSIISEGQTTENLYNKDIKLVEEKLLKILRYIDNFKRDLASLQSLFLIAMISHISSLHELSKTIRAKAIELAIELKLNYLDIDTLPDNFLDINGLNSLLSAKKKYSPANSSNHNSNSSKNTDEPFPLTPTGSIDSDVPAQVASISSSNLSVLQSLRWKSVKNERMANVIVDSGRRIFWELYFFDIVIGTADGQSLSKLCELECYLNFPTEPKRDLFDYELRSQLSKIVNDAIKLNIAINTQKNYTSLLLTITASLGNWELMLTNPKLFKAPYLINNNGEINNGIHQAIMMYSYAKIYTHRPFSYLYKPEILPTNPQCCSSDEDEQDSKKFFKGDKTSNFDSRKIIETRKTIDAANLTVSSLIDTNPSTINKRTPLIACSLAFASLVHLSAYLWIESKIKSNEDVSDKLISRDELGVFKEYLKLELNGIYSISNHWYLSNKLANHVKETCFKVLPNLYNEIRHFVPKDHNKITIELSETDRSLEVESSHNANNENGNEINGTSLEEPGTYFSNSNATQNNQNNFDILINGFNDNSPVSDTGCDWIDKSGFMDNLDFLNDDFNEIDYTFRL